MATNPAAPPSVDDAINSISMDDVIGSISADDVKASPEPLDPGADLQEASQANIPTWQSSTLGAALTGVSLGAMKAGIETKDFVFGEPEAGQKSSMRDTIEQVSRQMRGDSAVNGIAQSISQFGVGFIGLGKIGKGASSASRLAHWTEGAIRGAIAGGVMFDPHEERLSNLVQQYPALQNPVNAYLAAKPEDSAAEGRLKNALEGIVMDVGLSSALALAVKGIKYFRAGDIPAANEAAAKADTAFVKAADEDYSAKSFIDHDEVKAQQAAQQADALRRAGQVDDQGAGVKNFLDDEAPVPTQGLHGESADATILPANGGEANAQSVEANLGPSSLGRRDDVRGVSDVQGQRGPDGLNPPDGGSAGTSDVLPTSGAPAQRGADTSGTPAVVSPEDAERALKRLKSDNDALITYGGRDEAVASGYAFKSGNDTDGVIPWQKLQTTEQTQAWMGQLLDDNSKLINARRGGDASGVMSDKEVDGLVSDWSKTWNDDQASVRGALEAAGKDAPDLAVKMETAFVISNKAFQDAYSLAQRINSGNYAGYGSRQEALAALQHRMGMAVSMYANAKSLLSNSARALRRAQGQFKITDAQMENIFTSDPEAVLQVVASTGGDPAALARAGSVNMFQRIVNGYSAIQAAGMVAGWKTALVNFATAAANLVWRPLETGLGSIPQSLISNNAATVRKQSIREVTYLSSLLYDGLNSAKNALKVGDSIISPHVQGDVSGLSAAAGGMNDLGMYLNQAWKPLDSLENVVWNAHLAATLLGPGAKDALTAPFRLLGAADEFNKVLRYRAVVAAKASVAADEAGLKAGTQEYADYVDRAISSSVDDAGKALDQAALREAQTSVFQQDYIGKEDATFGLNIASHVGNLFAQVPPFRILVPFIKTPTNLFRYAVKLTPGLNVLQKEYRSMLSGERGPMEQARAMGQAMLGTMLMGTAYTLVRTGSFTGPGPQDVTQRQQWIAQGNRPYSYTWLDAKGVRQYAETSRFDPLASPLALMADFVALTDGGRIRDADLYNPVTGLFTAFMDIASNKTYLDNLTQTFNAVTDPKKRDAFFRRTIPGLVPMSGVLRDVTRSSDNVQRELFHWYDGLLAETPGYSATLPPQRDFLGKQIIAPSAFLSSSRLEPKLQDALNEMFSHTGKYLEPVASKSQNTKGVDLKDFTLESGRTAYDRYAELGGQIPGAPSLESLMSDFVGTDAYKNLPHGDPAQKGTKEYSLFHIVSDYRAKAFKSLLAESPKLRRAVYQSQFDMAKAVATGAKDVRAVAGQSRMDYFQGLLKTYGLSLPSMTIPPQ